MASGLSAAYNSQLMRSLQERDELHMAQDSMLVDIDDLIRSVLLRECVHMIGNMTWLWCMICTGKLAGKLPILSST